MNSLPDRGAVSNVDSGLLRLGVSRLLMLATVILFVVLPAAYDFTLFKLYLVVEIFDGDGGRSDSFTTVPALSLPSLYLYYSFFNWVLFCLFCGISLVLLNLNSGYWITP